MSANPAPTLSVVISVHNVAPYLIACLESVLAHGAGQHGDGRDGDGRDGDGRLEVVAVDDLSTDGSGAILDDYARRDARLRVVHLTRNVGLGGARNSGLAHARGRYVWFVDGDDWLPVGSVRAVLDRVRATAPDVLVLDHVEVFDDGRIRSGARLPERPAAPGPLAQCPQVLRLAQSACTKVARRAFLDEIELRFPPGWYEDCSYSHSLLMAAARIDVLDRVCYCYRQQQRSGAITKTRSERHFEVFDQYERLFATVDKAAPAYEPFRADLFRLMIDHYLVIVGNEQRLPGRLRRPFFRRMAQDYRRWVPITGYPMPGGVAGLKHQLVERDSYPAYAMLRWAYRIAGRLRPAGTAPRTPLPAAIAAPTAGAASAPTAAPTVGAAVPRQRRRRLSGAIRPR